MIYLAWSDRSHIKSCSNVRLLEGMDINAALIWHDLIVCG